MMMRVIMVMLVVVCDGDGDDGVVVYSGTKAMYCFTGQLDKFLF